MDDFLDGNEVITSNMAVTTIDFDTEFEKITSRLQSEYDKRLAQPYVRIWDGSWVLRGVATVFYSAEFHEIDSETGMGTIEMPADYYISQWIADEDNRTTLNVHITVDKDGVRWSGRMDHYEYELKSDGTERFRVYFKHDYEELKHILCWANPFLPGEIQFPRVWILFGPARWVCKTTLFCNLWRLETSAWMMPDDPMNISSWNVAGNTLDMSNWSMVLMPSDASTDNSAFAILSARMKDFHTIANPTFEDAQLTPTFRRYIETDDVQPIAGQTLRNGCLVIDIVDKSGYKDGTSFFGDIFSGLIYAVTQFTSEGYDDGTVIIADPAFPSEYSTPGWKGTIQSVPAIVYRGGPNSMIQTSLFDGSPPKEPQHMTGGHSMPGVNELISAAIQMAGDLIAAVIGVPPVGGATDAVLHPLYQDVFAAFMSWKDVNRAQQLGWSHYKEKWADGSDRAYTLSAVISLRTSLWATRNTHTHKLTVQDGGPWIVGQQGYGQFYLGDRIGSTSKMLPGKIYVDRVSEIAIKWDRKTAPTWEITIGQRKPYDPLLKAYQRIQAIMGAIHDLGVF